MKLVVMSENFIKKFIRWVIKNFNCFIIWKVLNKRLKNTWLLADFLFWKIWNCLKISHLNIFFVHKVVRYDVAGMKIFEIGEKYYFEDLGLRNVISGFNVVKDIAKYWKMQSAIQSEKNHANKLLKIKRL